MTTFKPILFSTPMVQALLEYRKNQTRRVIKGLEALKEPYFQSLVLHATGRYTFASFYSEEIIEVKIPYQVGDILWVRETFANGSDSYPYIFKANYDAQFPADIENIPPQSLLKWKPSIFMPKEACRLFLKVKDIRLELLQDISENDAIQEGIVKHPKCSNHYLNYHFPNFMIIQAKYSFKTLWEFINGNESWNKNPFVWVIEFERIEKPNDFIL